MVALLCGLLGLGAGALVAFAGPPAVVDAGAAVPVAAVSPSVPVDVQTVQPYARDIDYEPLRPGLALPIIHRMKNKLATWDYHAPKGWTAYSVCVPGAPCRTPTDTVIPPKRTDRNQQVRFRPVGEPLVGGYSRRVRILDNTLAMNTGQLVSTKVEPLLLRDVYGPSYDEIAEQVGAPLGTIKAQIHHGRKLARPLLRGRE